MSSTSKKHQQFCSEPMAGKPVTAMPGIGKVLGSRLESKGVQQSSQVLGKYLVENGNPAKFQNWVHNQSGANAKQQRDCYNGMKDWSANNL